MRSSLTTRRADSSDDIHQGATLHEPSPTTPDLGDEKKEKQPFLGLKPTQMIGGALASCTAAVLGGQLGVAGTVAGAALTSLTIAVGGAVYTRTFDKTKDGIGSAVSRLRLGGTPPATTPEDSAYATLDDDPTRVIAAQARAKDDVETVTPWYQRIAPVKVLVAAAGLFLIAAVVITGLEAIRGASVSGGEGTTIGQISRGEVSGSHTDRGTGNGTTDGQNSGAQVTEPTAEPSSTTTSEPTTDATTQPTTAATTAPTTDPTTEPTSAPTSAPTTDSGSGSEPRSGSGSGTGSGAASGAEARSGADNGSGPDTGSGTAGG